MIGDSEMWHDICWGSCKPKINCTMLPGLYSIPIWKSRLGTRYSTPVTKCRHGVLTSTNAHNYALIHFGWKKE